MLANSTQTILYKIQHPTTIRLTHYFPSKIDSHSEVYHNCGNYNEIDQNIFSNLDRKTKKVSQLTVKRYEKVSAIRNREGSFYFICALNHYDDFSINVDVLNQFQRIAQYVMFLLFMILLHTKQAQFCVCDNFHVNVKVFHFIFSRIW